MPDSLQKRILELLSANPYTIYFANELMEILDVPLQLLQQKVLEMAHKKLLTYTDASTKEGDDFMVKLALP